MNRLSYGLLLRLLLLSLGASLVGCRPEFDRIELRPYPVDTTQQTVLRGLTAIEGAITTEWAGGTAALLTAVQTLRTAPSALNLLTAQAAWRLARDPWERNEGFSFGPVQTEGIDGRSDDWPLDRATLDGLLAGNTVLDESLLTQLPTAAKGFHALEYLLFGPGGTQTVTTMSPRQLLLLNLLAANLNRQASRLQTVWTPGNGSFADQFIGAGGALSTYARPGDAIGEVLGAMSGILDELPNRKIERALASQNVQYNESQYADYSLTDYRNNVVGCYAAYTGRYASLTVPISLSRLVNAANPALDERVQTQFRLCMALLNLVPGTMNTAIKQQGTQLREIQTELNKLQTLLATDIPVALSL